MPLLARDELATGLDEMLDEYLPVSSLDRVRTADDR